MRSADRVRLGRCGSARRCARERRFRRDPLTICLGPAMLVVVGCEGPPRRIPLDPLPMQQAVDIVNENVAAIDGVLRATGSVDGFVTREDGKRQSYHLDAVLFYMNPTFVRFDLKAFGERQLLFGSNVDDYWVYDRQNDAYHCGRHGDVDRLAAELPAPPEQLVEVLGLRIISTDAALQRIEDEHQQVLVTAGDGVADESIRKEYWLDRFAPRLLRRLLYRDQRGVVSMATSYDDYRRLDGADPWLPYRISADWPAAGASMTLRVARWSLEPALGPESPQFSRPADCRER